MKKNKKTDDLGGRVNNVIILNPPEKLPPKNVNEVVSNFFEKRNKSLEEKTDLILRLKAQKAGIEEEVIKEVYSRGLNAYSESSPLTQEQHAMNRVNSFISGGVALLEDYDLIPILEAVTGGAARPHITAVTSPYSGVVSYHVMNNKNEIVHTVQSEVEARNHLAKNYKKYLKNEFVVEAKRGTIKAKRPGTGGAARPHVKKIQDPYNPSKTKYQVYDSRGNVKLSTQDPKMAYDHLRNNYNKYLNEEISKKDPRSRFEGTKSLVKIYKKDTPGEIKEDLRNWFNPSHPEGGWKRINSKGEAIGPCAREPGEPKPKCMSNEKRAKLSQSERASAVRAKRTHDPVADRSGKGGNPVNVSNFGRGKLSEELSVLEEANKPTNPSLWSRAKSLARSKFDVYPSAYANGWAAKWYKSKGGGWRSKNEAFELVDEGKKDVLSPHERDTKTILSHLNRDGWVQRPSGSGGGHDIFKYRYREDNKDKEVTVSLPRHRTQSPGVARTIVRQIHDIKARNALMGESAAWQRKEGKDPEGGLNRKGIASYRRENPGSELSMAVTTKPSKLKPGSKSANRRKSFCARMSGMKRRLTSAKTANDPNSRINKSLRKWNC
jgi:hypothetical protein